MSVVSGLAGAKAQEHSSEDASEASKYAADAASSAQRYMYDETKKLHQPYQDVGVEALPELQGFSPTAEARPFMEGLEGMEGLDLPEFDYSFDENDPGYQFRKKELEKTIDQASAARGNYNSRPTINALAEGNLALTADETDRQFGRKKDIYGLDYQKAGDEYSSQYGKLTDLYNMGNQLGLTDYNKLIDLAKIGQGSAAAAGSGALATGQGLANTYGTLGSNLGNAALMGGQAQADMWGGISGTNANLAMMYGLNKKQDPYDYSKFGGAYGGSGGGTSGGGGGGTTNNATAWELF